MKVEYPDKTKPILNGFAQGLLMAISPPAYVAQNEWRKGKYETRWGRAVGTTLLTGFTSVCCFLFGMFGDIPIMDITTKKGVLSQQNIVQEGRNLTFAQKEYCFPSKPLILRKFLFPLEGWARYAITDSYPKIQHTTFSGTVRNQGLEFSVEGDIPGLRDISTITDEILSQHTTSVKLKPARENYNNFYKPSELN